MFRKKPPFQQILPTLILLRPWTAFVITGLDRTYHASWLIFILFSLIFLFVQCGGHVGFLLHVKYTISHRIVHIALANLATAVTDLIVTRAISAIAELVVLRCVWCDCQLLGARHLVKSGRGITSPFVEVEIVGCDFDNNSKYKTNSVCM